MSRSKVSSIIFFFFIIAFASAATATATSAPSSSSSSGSLIGVTNTNRGRNMHQLQLLVTRHESLKINSVRLLDSDPDIIIRSFSYSSVSPQLTLPNSLVPTIASNQSEALHWFNGHVITSDPNLSLSKLLLTATTNTRQTLDKLGVSTAFPPPSAEFQESVAESSIKPVLPSLINADTSAAPRRNDPSRGNSLRLLLFGALIGLTVSACDIHGFWTIKCGSSLLAVIIGLIMLTR